MAENSIVLRQGQAQRVELEKVPVAAFYPGHLVELTSADKVQKHSTAGGSVAPIMFALEDENQGNGIDVVYATTGRAVCWIPQAGDWVLAVLNDDSAAVVIGAKLESAGNGNLTLHAADTADSDDAITVYDRQIVAIAMEALDLSGSSGEETEDTTLGYDKRLWVMIV